MYFSYDLEVLGRGGGPSRGEWIPITPRPMEAELLSRFVIAQYYLKHRVIQNVSSTPGLLGSQNFPEFFTVGAPGRCLVMLC